MDISFDRYHTYREVKEFLESCVREYPGLIKVYPIGKSYEGRDILAAELTNFALGEGNEKPGVYTDANTHAGEVTGCEVVLYTIKHLLENYGRDQLVTSLVDTRTFYFIPRITVDGSEQYLTSPMRLRSSVKPWPDTDEKPGLYPEDVDGDGKILTMRVKDKYGAWKISSKDPRLMVRRSPDDVLPGDYYSIYIEGFVKDHDPDLPPKAQSKYRLDFNRQYPANWALPVRQEGSGDFPFSEPEMKAVGDFLLAHPNIVTTMAYHTSGGYVLRPLCNARDSALDSRDLAMYRELGDLAANITGYPCVSVFEEFTWDQEKPEIGSDLEWFYEHLGILAFETELWDKYSRAGVPKKSLQAMKRMTASEREEEELKLLQWNDEKFGGRLFNNWRPFNHPQFGEVEIGGWEPKFGMQNPPPELLEEECRKNMPFTLTRAAASPQLVFEKVTAEDLGEGVYKVTAVVRNDGYLPTFGTFRALKMSQAQPVKVKLLANASAGISGADSQVTSGGAPGSSQVELISGNLEVDLGHLGGRAGGPENVKKVTWVVKAPGPCFLEVVASTPRAGTARAKVELK